MYKRHNQLSISGGITSKILYILHSLCVETSSADRTSTTTQAQGPLNFRVIWQDYIVPMQCCPTGKADQREPITERV